MSAERTRVMQMVDAEELIWLTQKLISIPSYHGRENPEKEISAFIHAFLRDNGIASEKVRVVDERFNVIGTYGSGQDPEKSLMLCGHLDTVGVDNMQIDPFEGYVRDGRIFGRGAVDMKGAVAAMIMALVTLKRSGVELSGSAVFAGVIDEEWWSEGARHLVVHGPRTRYAVVGEPTEMEIHNGHRGLEWLEIKVTGKYAHGGTPELGVNAIVKMNKVITEVYETLLPKISTRHDPVTGPATLNLGLIKGGTQPSTVAGECILQLDRRFVPGESTESVTAEIAQILDKLASRDPEFRAEVRNMRDVRANPIGNPPLHTSPSSPLVACLKSVSQAVRGHARIGRFPAWTDAGILSCVGGVESVVLGPGHLSSAHTEEEYCPIADIVDCCRIYTGALFDLCK
ncbi:MAG: M20 family metallopeptidase [Bacillota bacterium]